MSTSFITETKVKAFDKFKSFQGSGRNRGAQGRAQLPSDQVEDKIWTVEVSCPGSSRRRAHRKNRYGLLDLALIVDSHRI
jgi:hypothetical protein